MQLWYILRVFINKSEKSAFKNVHLFRPVFSSLLKALLKYIWISTAQMCGGAIQLYNGNQGYNVILYKLILYCIKKLYY